MTASPPSVGEARDWVIPTLDEILALCFGLGHPRLIQRRLLAPLETPPQALVGIDQTTE